MVVVNEVLLSKLVMNMPLVSPGEREFVPIDLVVGGKSVSTRIVAFRQGSTSDCGTMFIMKDVILQVV